MKINNLLKTLAISFLINSSMSYAQNISLNEISAIDNLAKKNIEQCKDSCYYINKAEILSLEKTETSNLLKISLSTILTEKDLIKIPIFFNKNTVLKNIELNNKSLNVLKSQENQYFALVNDVGNLNLILTIELKNSNIFMFENISEITNSNNKIAINKKENNFIVEIKNNEKQVTENNKEIVNSNNKQTNNNVSFYENNFIIEKTVFFSDSLKTKNNVVWQNNEKDENISFDYFLDNESSENIITNLPKEIYDNNKFFINSKENLSFETKFIKENLKIKNKTQNLQKVTIINDSSWFYEVFGGNNYKNYSQNTWFLFPGEELKINAKKLMASNGKSIVIDSINQNISKNDNLKINTINYQILSTIGQEIYFNAPKDMKIKRVFLSEIEQKVNQNEENKVFVKNGRNTLTIELEDEDNNLFFYKTPKISLLDKDKKIISSNNHEINISDFNNKFLIYSFGTDIYPSMFLIGVILIIGLMSYLLGNLPNQILNSKKWFIVLIGMSQVGIYAILATIILFLMISNKLNNEQNEVKSINNYNLKQIIILILSFVVCSSFFSAVYFGLLSNGTSYIDGINSNKNSLYFYSYDIKQANIIWTPKYLYNALMFAWSFFVASLLINLSQIWWKAFANPIIFMKSVEKKEIN